MLMLYQLALMPKTQKSMRKQVELLAPDNAPPRSLEADSRYLAVQHLIEAGAWTAAAPLLQTLQKEYPEANELTLLLNEAQLKGGVESAWQGKIKGRSRLLPSPRLFKLLIMVLLLTSLAGGAWQFLGQSRLRDAGGVAYDTLLEQAQSAMQNRDYHSAVKFYRQVLTIAPGNASAQQGEQEAAFELGLENAYAKGVQALNERQIQLALDTLAALERQAPNYRDTRQLLERARAAVVVEQHWTQAEAAYETQQWSTAVDEYEAIRQLDNGYQTELLSERLAAAYLQVGAQIVAQRPAANADLMQAKTSFQKALALAPALTAAQSEADLLAAYQTGVRALQQKNAARAITALEPLYQERPVYLGGDLAEQLYAAYLLGGDQAFEAEETETALDYYTKAAALAVADPSEAARRAQELSDPATANATSSELGATTAQVVLNGAINIRQGPGTNYNVIGGGQQDATYPVTGKNQEGSWWQIDYNGQTGWVFGQLVTAHNTETVSIAQNIPAPPAPAPAPAPAASSAPAPSNTFHGWIAFRSNRDGDTAIYLMQPDGGQQQRAPAELANQLDELYRQQQGTGSGPAQLYVASPIGRTDGNIYLRQTDPSASTAQEIMLTDFNGTEYDPTWSPNGAMIVFVANHTGNDEVWTLDVPSGAARQLTHNEWEWDKHPTWSPDGGQIAFFSNRTGPRQIWVMSADGSNQHNISNHQFEDWDPVWIR